MRVSLQRPQRRVGLRQRLEQLLVVCGELVGDANEVFDVGPQLSKFGGVPGAQLLQFRRSRS